MRKQTLLIVTVVVFLFGNMAYAKPGDVIWEYEQVGRIDSGIYITSVDVYTNDDEASNDKDDPKKHKKHKKEHKYNGKGHGHKKHVCNSVALVSTTTDVNTKPTNEAILILATSLQEFEDADRIAIIVALNPLTGAVIYETTIPEAEYIEKISTIGDTTGDGFDDYLVGAVSSMEDTYFMTALDGKTGEVVYTLEQESEPNDQFIQYFAPIVGDYNGNGKKDNVIIKIKNGELQGSVLGTSIIQALE